MLRFYKLKIEGKEILVIKIKNSLFDFVFLLLKFCCLEYKKILWLFKNLLLLNLFFFYYLNIFVFDDFDNIKKLFGFVNFYIEKI